MRRKIFSVVWILVTLIVVSPLAIAIPNLESVMASPTTVWVPDNYTTIQKAINAVKTGDIIRVRATTYYEHVVVNKTVSLIGEDSSATIIDGNGTGTVVLVTADNVVVSDLTVKNGEFGIRIDSSASCTISGINANDNVDGIHISSSYDCVVMESNASSNDRRGIFLNSAWNSQIIGNTVNNNRKYYGYGINLNASWNCLINGNVANNNYYDGLGFLNSSNCIVSENNVWSNDFLGIWLDTSRNITVSRNYFGNNTEGISLISSGNCTFEGNNIYDNQGSGVKLYYSNFIVFYHNNFVNNTSQVNKDEISFNNVWDNSYPSGGNHWNDYNGTDLYSGPYQNETGSDGIGDTPYVIDSNNRDRYPFVRPLSPPNVNFTYSPKNPFVGEKVIFNASASYDVDGSIVSYRWNFGDGNITVVTTPIITHAYAMSGTYSVILMVTDNHELTNSITKTIENEVYKINVLQYLIYPAIAMSIIAGLSITIYFLKIKKKISQK